jgi:hypothetical protein
MGTQMLQGPSESYLRQQFPQLYGFLGGVTGTAPDQMAGSVLDPNTAAVRQGAEYGFPVGTALAMLPGVGPLLRATKGLPVGMGIKDVSSVYPQAENLILAQQRAALPVSKGGLGLPAGNTAEQRAAAMFAEDVYHGTNAEKQILNDLNFSLDADQRSVGGIWTTKDKNYASWLADQKDKNNASVMSLKLLNAKNSNEYDILQEGIKLADEIGVPIPKNALEAQELLAGGYGWDRVIGDLLHQNKTPNLKITNFNDAYHSNPNEVTTAFITKDPSLFRLPNAAFDPFRRSAAIAATMGVAAPDLLAAPASVADQIDNINEIIKKKRKK